MSTDLNQTPSSERVHISIFGRRNSGKSKLVITYSQAFLKVDADTPKDIWMTSFSILMARFIAGAKAIDRLKIGDRALVSEGCPHHRQADDRYPDG